MLRDATTGIFARSELKERLQEEVARSRMTGEPLSLLLIDLDYFKSVNDAFGHSRGDAVLIEWVERLGQAIRSSDLPFRYGGDEFVVLLPNTPAGHAAALAHRLLAETRIRPFLGEPPLTLSLSVGVASFPDDTDTAESLFARADHRLFEAKRLGRGRVVDASVSGAGHVRINESVRLMERDDALNQMQRFLAQLSAGRGGVLHVEGIRGAGRTRFLSETQRAAEVLGIATLSLRGRTGHRGTAYATLREGLPDTLDPVLGGDPARHLFSLGSARSGTSGPLLVLLDDAADADRATLELLRSSLEPGNPRVLGLMCAVDNSRRVSVRHFEGPEAGWVELRPLSLGATRVWLRTLLQWEPPDLFLAWLHRETRGLPRFLHAGLVHLFERGMLTTDETGWLLRPHYAALSLGEAIGARTEEVSHNLPALSTTFVGRARELETSRSLLGRSRLLTLAGPGGIGKTRLAIELGGEVLDHYPDGIRLVELASVSNPGRVVAAAAAALGLAEEAGRPQLTAVTDHLQHRVMLLILDNCEHVIDAAAGLADSLLRQCPHLKIVATTRETLGVAGEQVLRVPPLGVPDPRELEAATADGDARSAGCDALRLFRDRAILARADFEITRANVPVIAQICRQLDGIPLAIELAAARVSVLPVEQIAARLEDRFRLLTGGSRTALPRQQTLKSLIDWSYHLLSPPEQRALRALSVFSGGWTLSAAEALFPGEDHELFPDEEAPDLFELLNRLVNKSLVQLEPLDGGSAEPRYRLLETIRQYACDRLLESGEADRFRRRHMDYFMRLGEVAGKELIGPNQQEWLERLETEHDNLRAALDWAQASAPMAGLRLASGLTRFWLARGHRTEGRERYAILLAANREFIERLDPAELGPVGPAYQQVLFADALLALHLRDSQVSVDRMEASAALAERLGDLPALAVTLCQLGYSRHQNGDEAGAGVVWKRGLELARQLGDPWVLGYALRAWGFHQQTLDHDEAALQALSEALVLLRQTGDDWQIANALWRMGVTRLWRMGDYRSAVGLFRESRQLWGALRDRVGVGHNLSELGWAVYFCGDSEESRRLFEEHLALQRERKDTRGLALALYQLGKRAQLEGDYDEAVEFLREVLHLDPSNWLVEHNVPWTLQTLGLIDLLQGRETRARERIREAVDLFRQRTDDVGLAACVQTLARARIRCNPEEAAALFGCVAETFARSGWRLAYLQNPEDPEDLATLRVALGERGLVAAREAGRRLPLAEAVAIALEEGCGRSANLTC
ncbi:MAG: diguanylate cyclase protein [Armatimonadetes bacterium]|nr:diguanylate cyclase protein [Armatimonadota bacterium]